MKKLKLWWQATRPFAYTVSVIPPVIGLVLAANETPKINWLNFALVLVGCVLAHAGSNLLSDYFDFQNGVDRKGTLGGNTFLVEGIMTPKEMLIESVVLFFLAAGIGAYFVLTIPNGPSLLWLIFLGGFLGLFYTLGPALKYRALGDLAVFIAFGPAMVLGAFFVHAHRFSWAPVLYSLPVALLVDAILHSNNLRDIKNDQGAGIEVKTVAMLAGENAAKKIYYALIFGSYLLVVILVLFADLSPFSLLTFLSVPLAIKLAKKTADKSVTTDNKFKMLDAETAKFHSVFSLLFIISLLLSLWIA